MHRDNAAKKTKHKRRKSEMVQFTIGRSRKTSQTWCTLGQHLDAVRRRLVTTWEMVSRKREEAMHRLL